MKIFFIKGAAALTVLLAVMCYGGRSLSGMLCQNSVLREDYATMAQEIVEESIRD